MERDKTIDNLRGLAMFAMMVLHAISYFFSDKLSFYIWDYNQWAVPVFLFCSFYLYFIKPKKLDGTSIISYFKKRLTRLFVPYYIFLLVFYGFLYFFDKKSFFNTDYLVANVFLYGGLSFNWLVLLFTYLIFLMPLILWLKQYKKYFYGFFILSLISSIYFIDYPINFRLTMWLPWSALAFFTIYFINNEGKWKKLFITAGLTIVVFILLRLLEINIGHNLSQYSNKYPPTLYHISYGIFSTIIIFWLSKKNVFNSFKFDKLLNFLSLNSYSLYFIHILVMYTLNWLNLKTGNWLTFFLIILFASSLIQITINKINKKLFIKI